MENLLHQLIDGKFIGNMVYDFWKIAKKDRWVSCLKCKTPSTFKAEPVPCYRCFQRV